MAYQCWKAYEPHDLPEDNPLHDFFKQFGKGMPQHDAKPRSDVLCRAFLEEGLGLLCRRAARIPGRAARPAQSSSEDRMGPQAPVDFWREHCQHDVDDDSIASSLVGLTPENGTTSSAITRVDGPASTPPETKIR